MNVAQGALRLGTAGRVHWTDRLARRVVLRQLGAIRHGQLVIDDAGQRHVFGAPDEHCGLQVHLRVHHPSTYRGFALGGSTGAGAAYIRHAWDADDLTGLIRLLAANLPALNRRESWRRRALAPLVAAARRRAVDREMARDAVRAHYDLGNDLYGLFLDPGMTYSAALFVRPGMDLEQAQTAKIDRLCRKLELSPEDHLLEIGTGWGSLAEHAARVYGCRVTTTTLSREQADYARDRIQRAGLADRVQVLECDYRDLEGQYDKIVSVEMIEAIGHALHGDFFRRLTALLKPHGLAALQAITIAEQRHDSAARGEDFIQRYVFPGGSLPSVSRLCGLVGRETDMQVLHLEDFGPHYARTLALWRERFEVARPQLAGMGYPPAFERLWAFYLAYCEGGFAERTLGVCQMLCAGPAYRGEPVVASLP